jgi:hypothetical protein
MPSILIKDRKLAVQSRKVVYPGSGPCGCCEEGGPACCTVVPPPANWLSAGPCASRTAGEPPVEAVLTLAASGSRTTSNGTEFYSVTNGNTRTVGLFRDPWGPVGQNGFGRNVFRPDVANDPFGYAYPECGACKAVLTVPVAGQIASSACFDLLYTSVTGITSIYKLTIEVGLGYWRNGPIPNPATVQTTECFVSLVLYRPNTNGEYNLSSGAGWFLGTTRTNLPASPTNLYFGVLGGSIFFLTTTSSGSLTRSGCSATYTHTGTKTQNTANEVVNESMNLTVNFADSGCTAASQAKTGCTNCGDTQLGGITID